MAARASSRGSDAKWAPRDGREGKAVLDCDRFQWLSFDCYGTLVDWNSGIATAIAAKRERYFSSSVQT